MNKFLVLVSLMVTVLQAQAFETVRVDDSVYALVGDLGQRSPENLGHNMTSGFIVTDDGVVVIDAGGSTLDAQAILKAIKKITDKPVKWLVNTGGQDHRWLGNAYFAQQGATIIAAQAGKEDMVARTAEQVGRARRFIKDKFMDTRPLYPDKTFQKHYLLPVKGLRIELIYTGGAHTRGDILVWLPERAIVFAGDTVFVQRLLGVQPNTALQWIKSLEYLRDTLKPRIVVPGHGHVTNLDEALHDSYDYLVTLRDLARKRFEEGAFDPVEAKEGMDQSRFSYLENYSSLSFRSRNALRVAEEVYETLPQ